MNLILSAVTLRGLRKAEVMQATVVARSAWGDLLDPQPLAIELFHHDQGLPKARHRELVIGIYRMLIMKRFRKHYLEKIF